MSQLYEDFKRYRDRFGLNQLTSTDGVGDTSQNGVLFTLEYLICLLEDETVPQEIKDAEIHRLRGVMWSCEVLPGLLRRHPESTEFDSMDDNGPALAFSALFGNRVFARNMRSHGLNVDCKGIDEVDDAERNRKYFRLAAILSGSWSKPKNYWNNQRPELFCLFSWFGRSPGFMGLVDLAARGWTTPFRWFSVLVGQFIGCFMNTGDTDARKLPYVTWYYLTRGTGWGQRWFWKLAYRVWTWILMRQYPGGMRDVYSIYYQDSSHPIRKYSKLYVK